MDAHEVAQERRDVLAALAERGHIDVNHVQAVEQIVTKRLAGDCVHETPVRDGHQPHIRRHQLSRSDSPQFPGLRVAQQPPLQPPAQVPKIMQHDGATVGGFETSTADVGLPVDVVRHVPEELGLQPGVRQADTVHRDERPGVARAAVVDRACDETAANAALTRNQHRDVGFRRDVDLPLDPSHHRAVPDDHQGSVHFRQGQRGSGGSGHDRGIVSRINPAVTPVIPAKRLGNSLSAGGFRAELRNEPAQPWNGCPAFP